MIQTWTHTHKKEFAALDMDIAWSWLQSQFMHEDVDAKTDDVRTRGDERYRKMKIKRNEYVKAYYEATSVEDRRNIQRNIDQIDESMIRLTESKNQMLTTQEEAANTAIQMDTTAMSATIMVQAQNGIEAHLANLNTITEVETNKRDLQALIVQNKEVMQAQNQFRGSASSASSSSAYGSSGKKAMTEKQRRIQDLEFQVKMLQETAAATIKPSIHHSQKQYHPAHQPMVMN